MSELKLSQTTKDLLLKDFGLTDLELRAIEDTELVKILDTALIKLNSQLFLLGVQTSSEVSGTVAFLNKATSREIADFCEQYKAKTLRKTAGLERAEKTFNHKVLLMLKPEARKRICEMLLAVSQLSSTPYDALWEKVVRTGGTLHSSDINEQIW